MPLAALCLGDYVLPLTHLWHLVLRLAIIISIEAFVYEQVANQLHHPHFDSVPRHSVSRGQARHLRLGAGEPGA